MPRRIYRYADLGDWAVLNFISTLGSLILCLGVLVTVYNAVRSLKRGHRVGPDPWKGNTLEWFTPSSPPPHNFDSIPRVRSVEPMRDIRSRIREAGGQQEKDGAPWLRPEKSPVASERRGPACRDRARLASSVSSATFAIGAAVVGNANVWAPFERGWWLTAYLLLVGDRSQLLLSRGQDALATRAGEPSAVLLWIQSGLWNAGTAIVAVARHGTAQSRGPRRQRRVAAGAAAVPGRRSARRMEATPKSRRPGARLREAAGRARELRASRTFLAGAFPGQ